MWQSVAVGNLFAAYYEAGKQSCGSPLSLSLCSWALMCSIYIYIPYYWVAVGAHVVVSCMERWFWTLVCIV